MFILLLILQPLLELEFLLFIFHFSNDIIYELKTSGDEY